MSMQARHEQLDQARLLVDHLRSQAEIDRTKVSVSTQALLTYIQENEMEDPLVNPLAQSDNPFKPKNPCAIL
ncbi:PREDICTED: guanine nucleotide-binding protein G(I)/G(S)/G(O) subunit gamma-7-like [Amphimedon queenslandica]|uniref:Guanine nucleotide-binding protein subunit gamma n=1 Tax=Amphimedon queenslandica TaxID=400682 RepID=A0A1X7VI03_AMPQE|nr:PREDICTED: guanine nucleotide-binding protein G(I)/G(S)/G(O) subunit gamma-7-like [Amphimedon queenslandica]|eukprot:XP_003384229.1 PREDICTED: guanine nucleotide-binding protein G(I)/G(S)/G(O) subunit gamma-7-like [Amphimedon queenslandica]